MDIDIKELENIKTELDSLDENEVVFIKEGQEDKYVIMPIGQYEFINEILSPNQNAPKVKVINASNIELTYDEYENVKREINEIIEKTFKPKPEKLN